MQPMHNGIHVTFGIFRTFWCQSSLSRETDPGVNYPKDQLTLDLAADHGASGLAEPLSTAPAHIAGKLGPVVGWPVYMSMMIITVFYGVGFWANGRMRRTALCII